MHKTYLGDSVYAELNEARQIVLTTENGYGPSNTICLEPEVVRAFNDYIARIACILMSPTKPTTEEVAAEIAALKALKPTGIWQGRTQEAIDIIIETLEGKIDFASPDFEERPVEQREVAHEALAWLDGLIAQRPSAGWEGLVEVAE